MTADHQLYRSSFPKCKLSSSIKYLVSQDLEHGNVVVQSFAQSCPSLCNPMDCSTPGSLVLHYLLKFALFQWISSSHQVAKVLEFQLQYQFVQWIFKRFPLGWTGWISLQSKGLLQHHSSKASILRRSAFFIVQLLHPYTTTGESHSFHFMDLC